MKLASIRYGGRDLVAAELDDGRVVDVAELISLAAEGEHGAAPAAAPRDMLEVISLPAERLDALAAALERARSEPGRVAPLAADAVAWRPPVPRPGKICAVAMNNSASNERKISAPDHPAFFLKPASCLVGHLEPIRVRPYYGSVHPEPELAVVIGRRTRDVDFETALDAVFGYTIFDDITSNGMRSEDRFHYYAIYASQDDPDKTERVEQHLSYAGRYKGTDTFGAMGPWLVTRDEIHDPDELTVVCRAGGETIAEDSTRYYNYKVAQVVSFISQFLTLDPGDVISMGTAFKPGARRKSIHHANLQYTAGPIEISIDGLGTLSNPVVVEERPLGRWR
jgi:2-keto-4-pentenoate hydratase/2-oxohepta-3-ene-1,7-dioic acid hydratase in catechol pathway